MKIGILTAGGDCPGLNAAIRGIGKTAITQYGYEVIGFSSGFTGLINNEFVKIKEDYFSNLLTLGGTILGTSREKPFKKDQGSEKVDKIIENYKKHKLDCLVVIGGNGTMKTAWKLTQSGLNIIGVPKTIDNDVWGTDVTFGFDSAVQIATEAIDRLHTTANSHKRVMVIELMGNKAGWITLYSGIAGGGDIILIPEIEYSEDDICKYIDHRASKNKAYSIVVVAEGIRKPENINAAKYIGEIISKNTGYETRETVLGYIQRGGTPSPMDRLLATRYGAGAVRMIANKQFGNMVALRNNEITKISLQDVSGKLKTITPDNPLLKNAVSLGSYVGK